MKQERDESPNIDTQQKHKKQRTSVSTVPEAQPIEPSSTEEEQHVDTRSVVTETVNEEDDKVYKLQPSIGACELYR